MTKKLTTEEFIARARKVHGDKYDYSKVEYKNRQTKVCIICPRHGEFWQTPAKHLSGQGCPKCKYDKIARKFTKSTEQFIAHARKVHGDKYDYSKINYTHNKIKVCIICPEHGEFWQQPNNHLAGQGCPKCRYNKIAKKLSGVSHKPVLTEDEIERKTFEFIFNSNYVHGNKYDYSRVHYINNKTKVCIICPEHGEFWQAPSNHLSGQGCPKCGRKRTEDRHRKTIEQFIRESRKVHGNKYDYSKVNYTHSKTKVCIICPEHGPFWQTPNRHLAGQGCPKCSLEKAAKCLSLNGDEFVIRARKAHGDKYDYSKVKYKNGASKVKIICPKHGEFWQRPSDHLYKGQGCPSCTTIISKPEQEIADWVGSLGLDIVQSYRGWCQERPNLEIDIFMPEFGIGIEYHGLYWHSERFAGSRKKSLHYQKFMLARKYNIRLIQIFSHEWEERKDQIRSFLRSVFGKNQIKVGARQCRIVTPDKIEARKFLEKYHIQGASNGRDFIGLEHPNHGIIAIAQFGHHHRKAGVSVLQRFCGKENITVAGGLSKIMKHFNGYCVTWSDNRWTDGNGYEKTGFVKEEELGPDYFYVDEYGNVYSKQSQKKGKVGCPEGMTEKQWCEVRGLFRVWDAGKIRWRFVSCE